jgi:uncharacterized damage-inducible protein DinB
MNLYGPKRLADSMRTVRKGTILIAEDIHEDDYGFRPSRESRSAGEILTHIAFISCFDRALHEMKRVTTLEGFDFGNVLKESELHEKKLRTKSELIHSLKESGESFALWVERVPEEVLSEDVVQPDGSLKTRFEMILDTKEHEMHHRGQLTVIERLVGVIPHLTRRR